MTIESLILEDLFANKCKLQPLDTRAENLFWDSANIILDFITVFDTQLQNLDDEEWNALVLSLNHLAINLLENNIRVCAK